MTTTTLERCNTCKHWDPMKEGDYNFLAGSGACIAARQILDVTTETDSPDYERKLLPEHAGLLCMVSDGSEFAATLITMRDFGCVMHSPKDNAEITGLSGRLPGYRADFEGDKS